MFMIQAFPKSAAAAAALFFLLPVAAQAQDTGDPQTMAVHGQATMVVQGVGGFDDPYRGPNSLAPKQVRETIDVTLYAGVRPWAGGEL